jgi:hypothetical protein
MTETKIHWPRVILPFQRDELKKISDGSKVIQGKFAAAPPILGTPPVTPTALLGFITAYDTANLNTKTTKAATGARTAALDDLWIALHSLLAFVQNLIFQTPQDGASIAEAAGMKLANVGDHVKEILAVEPTSTPTTVRLRANLKLLVPSTMKKYSRKTILWRQVIAGVIVNLPSTPVANTTVTGLPLNTEVGFQAAVQDSKDTSEWTQVVSIYIHPTP